jgi:hypothetical protein
MRYLEGDHAGGARARADGAEAAAELLLVASGHVQRDDALAHGDGGVHGRAIVGDDGVHAAAATDAHVRARERRHARHRAVAVVHPVLEAARVRLRKKGERERAITRGKREYTIQRWKKKHV